MVSGRNPLGGPPRGIRKSRGFVQTLVRLSSHAFGGSCGAFRCHRSQGVSLLEIKRRDRQIRRQPNRSVRRRWPISAMARADYSEACLTANPILVCGSANVNNFCGLSFWAFRPHPYKALPCRYQGLACPQHSLPPRRVGPGGSGSPRTHYCGTPARMDRLIFWPSPNDGDG